MPNIQINLPQVYMCSPSWTLLPPPSAYHPSGSSQCTSPKHPVSCIEPGLATRFIHGINYYPNSFVENHPSKAEKAMATHSSTLAWKIPWAEEPGGLQSMGSRRIGHLLSDFIFTFHFHALEKEMATHSNVQYSCLEDPRDGGAWWAAVSGVAQSRTWLKRLSSSSSSPLRIWVCLIICYWAVYSIYLST